MSRARVRNRSCVYRTLRAARDCRYQAAPSAPAFMPVVKGAGSRPV
jgi:hypothetical protein